METTKFKGYELKAGDKVKKFDNYTEVYDANGNFAYFENSDGDWAKWEYDANDNETYFENSDGEWAKYEYDANDNITYYEYSDRLIID